MSATAEKDPKASGAAARRRWLCDKPTVTILFYTDDERINLSMADLGGDNGFGVFILRRLILEHGSDLADFEIVLVNRHDDGHGQRKLTPQLLADYDQVWFFGGEKYANTRTDPENELTDSEVDALESWMRTGGVLMTGDHADPRPDDVDPDLNDMLGLGRAIGHRVPRAGKLRRWEGPPGKDDVVDPLGQAAHPYNTQRMAHALGDDPDNPFAEEQDDVPQRLILTTYGAPQPLPFQNSAYAARVHPLFCGRTSPITVFPDHMHEGHLNLPGQLPAAEWPSAPNGVQPRPEVVARGINTHGLGEPMYDLVVAYDGSAAGVGRIVADSTFHHYFNFNLVGFVPDGDVINQFAQYYVNLAVWLCPTVKRGAIFCHQRWRVVSDPSVQMAATGTMHGLGRAAAGES